MNTNEVDVAFEILLEAIERVKNQLHEAGAVAFRAGDYDKARRAIEEVTRLADFHEKLKTLRHEWKRLTASGLGVSPVQSRPASKGRLKRGLRTPEVAFQKPILEALVELGGSAPIGEVLERVEAKMANVLNQYDREPLPSAPRSIRWKNTAQWCRNRLVREGLMKSDSPYGVWEISDAGKKWLLHESER